MLISSTDVVEFVRYEAPGPSTFQAVQLPLWAARSKEVPETIAYIALLTSVSIYHIKNHILRSIVDGRHFCLLARYVPNVAKEEL